MIKVFLDTFISNLIYALEVKTFKVKMLYSLAFSIMISPIAYLSEFARNYLIPEKQFFSTVIFLCICDVLIGTLKSLKLHNFNPMLMLIGFATKLGTCYLVMQIFQAVSSPQEFISSPEARVYFVLTWKLMIMVYPSISSFNNIYYLSNKKFPPIWWMERMHSFEKDGNVKDLIGNNKQEQNESVEPAS